ncbi:MAG: pre-peptidase C-terminal domain-containing protein [Pyrinomonadaceae bacterium]|nr:pre-peptidase C-terminal domain-containing protein [Pyrinomonadaceae bacterium]
MKRNLKLLALLVMAVLFCSGALALTLAGEERSQSAGVPQAALAPAPARNQGGKTYSQDVAKILRRHHSVELEPQGVAEQVRLTGRLSLPTAQGTFDLTLTPHDMLAPDYRSQVTLDGGEMGSIERGPVRTYKGTVAGMNGAQARFTIDENTLEGLIITASRLYFVEPARRYSALASSKDFIVYNDSDVIESFGECGVTLAEKVGSEAARLKSQVTTAQANSIGTEELFSPPRAVDLATEADFEYFTFFGSSAVAANNEIISIVNQVDGIYNTQFGVRFTIVFQNVWATPDDPYTTTEAKAALDQFRDYWNSNNSQVSRDLAHMWTGKDFDGTTIGIAFRPGMDCPLGPLSYGMSQRLGSTPAKFLLTAHEIGHNFNASHTDDPVQPGCENTIMSSTLGAGSLQQFCPFSANQIETHANSKVACLSQAVTPGCTYSLFPTSQSFGVDGGPGSTQLTTGGASCVWGATSSVGWIMINSSTSGTNSATISFTVSPNNAGFARSGIIRVADQNFTVSQAGGAACAPTPISYGQTINASLSTSDCRSSHRRTSYADQYSFSGAAGDQIRIEMTSTATPVLDTYLYLMGPNGTVLTENDDIVLVQNTNSRIPVSGFFTLPAPGLYVIEATSYDIDETGSYNLTLTSSTSTPMSTVQFSSATATAPESGNAFLTVTRTGNQSTLVSVGYSTSDGTAISNSDYLPASGTIDIPPGENSRTIVVHFINDSVVEPSESFNVTLNNPGTGVTIGAPSSVVVTITDDDVAIPTIDLQGRITEGGNGLAGVTVWLLHQATQQTRSTVTGSDGRYQFSGALLNNVYEVIPFKDGYWFSPPSLVVVVGPSNLGDITATLGNPIDGSTFFVTKHYEDFFGRQPDAPGLQFWVNGINSCDALALCRVKRIDTSAAFFLSIEFQETGYLVYRLYKAAYGDLAGGVPFPVRRAEFIPDTRTIGSGVVVGQAGWEQVLENNKQSFVGNFVNLTRFANANPTSTTPTEFVNTLFTRAGVTPSAADREAAVAEFGSALTSADAAARARALRKVAENSLLKTQEFNKAFVLMQYFGYLQRNPDDAPDNNLVGYNFWLTKLNQFNGDFRQADMVKAFITSSEYRSRFGPP